MRKAFLVAAAAALGVAGAVIAAEFKDVDKNSDGRVSLEEVKVVMPNITEDEFSSYDGNADGSLNENEFAIWEAAAGDGSQTRSRSQSQGDQPGGDQPRSQQQPR
jgi:hypothetical protein